MEPGGVAHLSAWAEEGKPLRLIQRSVAKDDPEPKAISCYGLYLPEIDETWIRFVDGRPVTSITTRFLSWSLREARRGWQEGPRSHLGQRQLARLQRGQAVARKTQPPRQGERRGSEDRRLPASEAEPVAELHRAQVGTRASARSSSRTGFSEHTSLPRGCAGSSVVRITSISPFHRRSPDHALR